MKDIREAEEKEDNSSLHEINRYTDPAFPIGAYEVTRQGIMPEGRGYKDLHWHEELQFTCVVGGRLKIRIDGEDYEINEGEAAFINRNLLHITTDLTEDGKYISLNFPDKLLGFFPGSRMEQDYVLPYTRGYMLPAVVLKKEEGWQEEILKELKEVLHLLKGRENEYQIAGKLVWIWQIFIEHMKSEVVKPTRSYIRKQERIQTMLTYIHEHYMEEIRLREIAEAAAVSVAECCKLQSGTYGSVSLSIL